VEPWAAKILHVLHSPIESDTAFGASSKELRRILSDHTIIQCPDCLFRCDAQSAFCMMTAHVNLDDRLSILRERDRFRKWESLDDQRVCNVCERKFKGRQIEIRRFPGGRCKLYCPTLGCSSGPHQWVYPQTPVVSEMAKHVWPAGKQPAHRQVESALQARGHRV
jgi:hypothetical protein